MFSDELTLMALVFMAVIAVCAGGYAVLSPFLSGEARASKRMAKVAGKSSGNRARHQSQEIALRDQRRRQVQDTLKQLEEKQRSQRKRLTLANRLEQAGLSMSVRTYWVLSALFGLVVALLLLIMGYTWQISLGAAFTASLGVPRWLLAFIRKRHQQKFLDEFANAIDVIVRALKAGLPVNDALRVIASESPAPVGPEFAELVEAQKLGVTLDQGLERMYERMPLPEVRFLGIVVAIQQRTGGNLSEALNNLSKVLRDRKKMQAKIKAMSQEAKSSAAIIGALPPAIMLLVYLTRPAYIALLWETQLGQIMLLGSALWMLTGVLVMRKMINFDF